MRLEHSQQCQCLCSQSLHIQCLGFRQGLAPLSVSLWVTALGRQALSQWCWSPVQVAVLKILKLVQKALPRDAAATCLLAVQATSSLTLSLLFGSGGHDSKKEEQKETWGEMPWTPKGF